MMKNASFWIQFVCFFVIVLSCLLIGFGSWLETNNQLYSSFPSVNQYLSVFNVAIVLSAAAAVDTYHYYLTFGLWRYCISNADGQINKCSSVRVNFDIDAIAAINNSLSVAQNDTQQLQLPHLQPVSYIRSIPLLVATILGVLIALVAAFLLRNNQKKSVQRRALLWVTSISSVLCALLISIAFGVTFYKYSTNIQAACSLLKQQNNQYICSSYTPSLEIILLGLAMGLFIISSVYCYLIVNHSQSPKGSSYKTHNTTNSNFSFYANTENNSQQQQEAEENINEKTQITMEDDEMVWNKNRHEERLSLRPPPPSSSQSNGRCRPNHITDGSRPPKRSQKNHTIKNHSMTAKSDNNSANTTPVSSLAAQHNRFTSSELSIDSSILVPPTLPFAAGSGNSRRTSVYSGIGRPLSHGSDNTFGAAFNNNGGDADYSTPSIDDSGSMTSSYMDYSNRNNRSYSNASQMVTHNNTNLYATTNGAQSNHTLSPFTTAATTAFNNNRPNIQQHYPTNTSSFEDVSSSSHNSSFINIPQQQDIIASVSSSSAGERNDDLHKRINDYLHKS